MNRKRIVASTVLILLLVSGCGNQAGNNTTGNQAGYTGNALTDTRDGHGGDIGAGSGR